jgi:hypothetical protein
MTVMVVPTPHTILHKMTQIAMNVLRYLRVLVVGHVLRVSCAFMYELGNSGARKVENWSVVRPKGYEVVSCAFIYELVNSGAREVENWSVVRPKGYEVDSRLHSSFCAFVINFLKFDAIFFLLE